MSIEWLVRKPGLEKPRAATSRNITAEMSWHNTPVKAHTQITKLQNATARLTPAKPAQGAVARVTASEVGSAPVCCQTSVATRVSAVFMAMPLSKPPGSTDCGKGLGAGVSLFAQQHDGFPAQHSHALATTGQGGGIAPPGSTWANWKTSPSSTVMKVLMPMAVLRGSSFGKYSDKARQICSAPAKRGPQRSCPTIFPGQRRPCKQGFR